MINFKNKYLKVPLLYSGTGGGSILPTELQACEYIRSSSNRTCFIKTNIKYDHELTIKFRLLDKLTNVFFFGYSNSNIVNSVGARCISSNNIQIFAGNNNIIKIPYNEDINIIKISDNKVIFNDTEYSVSSSYTNDNISLFYGGGSSSKYYCDIMSFDSLIASYIRADNTYTDNKGNTCPAGTPGMFDTVNQIFYTNDGTGNFTPGPDINI